MDDRADHRDDVLGDIAALVLAHPGLRAKAGLGLVTDVLGPTDWITGPGDDAAAIRAPAADQETFLLAAGEAIFPPFVRADPFEAGVGAVVANVNDIAAMGGRPAGIVDTIVAPEPSARLILEGLQSAAGRYGIPVVGGHLSMRDGGDPSLSAFAFGHARRLLSATRVASGQTLLLACCLDGTMRADFPFFSSFQDRGDRLAGDIGVLADLAEGGHCQAAKDVSMAGLLGSLAMLLEPSGCGATVDLDEIPRPPGVPVARWLQAFPLFSFLLCAPAEQAPACREAFSARDLSCATIGQIDGTGQLRVRSGARDVCVLDLARDRVTGLRPPSRPAAAG
ncbi:MAG: AIR synthase related protein [Streptosporangiaceae bacterium]